MSLDIPLLRRTHLRHTHTHDTQKQKTTLGLTQSVRSAPLHATHRIVAA